MKITFIFLILVASSLQVNYFYQPDHYKYNNITNTTTPILQVSDFAQFEYYGNYKISGTGYNRNTFSPNITSSNDVVLYVNSDFQRVLWANGAGDSYFMNLANGSYFWGNIIRNFTTGLPICLYRPDFGYAQTVSEFRKSFRTDVNYFGYYSEYFGSIFDYGGCGAKFNHHTEVLNLYGNNIITRQIFMQQLFNPLVGFCFDFYGEVDMNELTLRFPTTTDFNSVFQLSPLCATPADYCDYAFPGNLCH